MPFFFPHRANPVHPSVFTSQNISKIRDCYNVQLPTVIVFHGWWGSETSTYERNLTAVYLTRVSVAACAAFTKFEVVASWSVKVASCARWRRLLLHQHFSLSFVRNGYRGQKKNQLLIWFDSQFYPSLCSFQLHGEKTSVFKKVQKFSTWFESVCELDLRIRAIINSPTCLVIKGEKNRF